MSISRSSLKGRRVLTTQKESVKVVQELMRHADPKITLKLYAQGEEMPKRAAHLHLEDLFIANLKAPLTIDASAAAVYKSTKIEVCPYCALEPERTCPQQIVQIVDSS